jgi:hypothetical protein
VLRESSFILFLLVTQNFSKVARKRRFALPIIDFSEAKFPLKSGPCQGLKNVNRVVSFVGTYIFGYVFVKCCKSVLKNFANTFENINICLNYLIKMGCR